MLEDVEGTPKANYYDNGNLLLDKLFGAKIHQMEQGQDCIEFADQLMQSLAESGKKPYLIPIGGSNEIGSMGYVRCANEIVAQITEQALKIDKIVIASGSAGTQAGMLAGLIAADVDIPVIGIAVSRSTQEQHDKVAALLEKTLLKLEMDPLLANNRVITDGSYYGTRYGITTAESTEAVSLLAQLEGVLLDPVYTGKGMAGLIDKCRKQHFAEGENILFLHTGGSQALFAY